MPAEAIGISVLIFAVSAALVWVSSYPQFVLVLAIFSVTDHGAWRYLVKFLRPIIEYSRKEYVRNNDYVDLEKLRLVEYQVCGAWKWWRGLMGSVLILAMLGLVIFGPFGQAVKVGQVEVSWAFVQSLSILIWVLAMEAWHWVIRIKTKVSVDALEALRDKYTLSPF